jgi:formate hydrogenlyase transcriptional activator
MSATEKLQQDRIDPRNIPEAIRQEAMLDGLLARVPEAIVLLDTDDRVLQVNREFTKIFGYAQEEACGRLINELVVPEELSAEADEYTRRGLRGESLDVETVRKHKDGTRVHVSIISGPVSISGSQISEYVIYREITERKRAEEALQKSERKLAAIINTIPTAAWTTRPDGYCDFINQVWLEYAGMTAEQAQGWGWTDAVHQDDRKRLVEEWQSCLASGTPVDTEARIRRFDGSYRWFLIRGNPLRDESGNILKWYGTCTDIEDRKRGEETLRARELSWRQIVDNIPGLVATMGAMGEVEFLNRQILEYFGKTNEDLKHWALTDAVHPDDLPRIIEARIKSIEEGRIYEVEHRCRRADGVYRWFQVRGLPVRDTENKITAWYLLLTDIDDRKRAEQKLRQSEDDLRTITDTIRQPIVVLGPDGTTLYVNQVALDVTGYTRDQLDEQGFWARVVHPNDLKHLRDERRERLLRGVPFDLEFRALFKNGQYRWQLMQYNPLKDESGQIIRWYSSATDIDDRKRAEEKLRQSEEELRTITDTIRQFIVVLAPDGTTLYANKVALENTGLTVRDLTDENLLTRDGLPGQAEAPGELPWNQAWTKAAHPDDLNRIRAERRKGLLQGAPFELEVRLLLKNGQYRWQLFQYNPLKDESGRIIRWYCTATDIDDRKRAEQKLKQSEEELRTITDTIRQPIVVLAPDGALLYANRVALDNSGLTMSDVKDMGYLARAWHPDDVDRALDERNAGLSKGFPFDSEMRLLFKNGQYRWQLVQYDPLKDERGQIIRWYATVTDIDDRKKTEERLHNENVVLREEIDRSSMFEEIVGSSKPMSHVLKKVEKVAPSDSTVLILGETGTGKELIARALHRRSKRASRAFVKVNCAAIPQSLIASELFGHEKGAFTGALQRRAGRFEAANGGTLFLDEIGELPMETQIALLRVLQEKEFERVGSNHPISVDVRVIAATNRDLPAAVAAGSFRQDLFYRLNVFPIDVPPLCERSEDIPLLVEYFVGRFAKEAGKRIRHIGRETLEQLQAYHWPGNIRELQNVVERAVILSDTDTFVVDESWLQSESAEATPKRRLSTLEDREVEMIETALAETHGRISGPTGAAAKLGIPRQTLESKIRRLGIDKYGQKRPTP